MSRLGTYDLVNGFVPYDDCQQEEPKMTNADRIRSMTDEKLAELLRDYQCNTCDFNGFCDETDKCEEKILEWLKQEREGE